MDNDHGITCELREWAEDALMRLSAHKDLLEIADRIDVEHNAMLVDARMTVYQGYVELPKDADGEYIHIGDEVEWWHTCGSCELRHGIVTGIKTDKVGDELFHEIAVNDGGFLARLMASDLRHYQPPTVEDVLREMLEKWGEMPANMTNEAIVDEYAAKLRLAGDEE